MSRKNNSAKITERELSLLSEKKKKYNPSVSKKQCIADLRRVQRKYPSKYISRTLYRIYGKYSDATWNQFFGTFHEFRRHAGLELNRHQHQMERQIAKHASYDHYREFFAREVLPYHDKYKKKSPDKKRIKTGVIGSDMHDEEIDQFCLEVFIDQCKILQPDFICLNGDIFDLYEFSRFTKDPRRMDVKSRYKFVHERIFGPLRAACPNSQIDFIMGNHEFRFLRLLADQTPNLRVWLSDLMGLGFAEIFGLDEYEINWISKLDFGAYTPQDIRKEIKKNSKVYYECYKVTHEPPSKFDISGTNGHHHRLEVRTRSTEFGGQISWVQTPGMHRLDAEYVEDPDWNLGFNIVHIDTVQKNVIQQPVQVHEQWALVNGIYYQK